MRFICCDDELLALDYLVSKIKKIDSEAIINAFSNPKHVLEFLVNNDADIAFLDIEMFGTTGIELAKKIKDIKPHINIIFVTGYSEYAFDAFKVRATGYLLKPADEAAIKAEIENVLSKTTYVTDKRVVIQTFGNFEILVDNEPVKFKRSKSKELLAYLVDRRGSSVTTQEASVILWENNNNEKSLKSMIQTVVADLMNTLKSLGVADIINKSHNSLAINKTLVSCDFFDFLNGNTKAINQYAGEYMYNYNWAEFTNAFLNNKK